jgi:predicted glycogen debranching enzyme
MLETVKPEVVSDPQDAAVIKRSAIHALDKLVHRIAWPAAGTVSYDEIVSREWLVSNGLGGYASGTVAGAITRRYHAPLIAALPAPHGRVVMLNHVSERVRLPDRSVVWLGVHSDNGKFAQTEGTQHLVEFRLEAGLPVWRYQIGSITLEKRLLLINGQNTVHVRYQMIEGNTRVRLGLRPLINFRSHDAYVSQPLSEDYTVNSQDNCIEVSNNTDLPPLRLIAHAENSAFTVDSHAVGDINYVYEEQRGYEHNGPMWSPGYFRADLTPDRPVTLIASAEPWSVINAIGPSDAAAAERARRIRLLSLAHPSAHEGPAAELVLAADQFIITPAGRVDDAVRALAVGDEVRTVIAGYHWFTDWGRDTMISLDGLTLVTGRHREAGYIVRTFAQYVRDGLIPNLFPEGEQKGLYHTADATLWFFHALDRYVSVTQDYLTLELIRPTLLSIVEHHLGGTHFNIKVDPDDGLLMQGQAGYQLTWMDAKVGDWVVTPRRGKAVEINALWYNALRLLEGWMGEAGDTATAERLSQQAERARVSFNRRFWNESAGYLYDVVDVDGQQGNDDACRPNQVLAMSRRHPILDRARWEPVLDVVRERLLTPVGLRSLAPGSADYKARYFGDLRARDAAYHQGTVWAWLIGPFIDAWLAAHPDDVASARAMLEGFVQHLEGACIGSISEVFDAEDPFTARGCIAQAWSVAEVLRAWTRTSGYAVGG